MRSRGRHFRSSGLSWPLCDSDMAGRSYPPARVFYSLHALTAMMLWSGASTNPIGRRATGAAAASAVTACQAGRPEARAGPEFPLLPR